MALKKTTVEHYEIGDRHFEIDGEKLLKYEIANYTVTDNLVKYQVKLMGNSPTYSRDHEQIQPNYLKPVDDLLMSWDVDADYVDFKLERFKEVGDYGYIDNALQTIGREYVAQWLMGNK